MIVTSLSKPLPFNRSVEQPQPGDEKAIASINGLMHGILETTWSDYGHSVRSVHAKSHGLLEGELQVLDGLPPELAQGVFARPATYPVVLRISTNPGDILDDTVSAPRGIAMKIIGVDGERLPGSEGETTQDFILVNGPAFVAPDAAHFNKSLKLLAATTNTGQLWKKGFSALLRGAVAALGTLGKDAGPLKALGGQPMTHPLGETFYTQTPYRHGKHVAKLSLAPVSAKLKLLKDQPVALAGKPNGLRGAVIDYFGAQGGEWELRVQLRTNPETMPVEDASVPWPETESPYVAVARITVAPQPAWSEARAVQADDGLSFSPWHGIADHQPLGSINRARKDAYRMSADFRVRRNGCPIHEPTAAIGLSDATACPFGSAPGREGRRPNTPDARPGTITQPLNATARRITAGIIGATAAGILVSAVLAGLEAASGEPSDLIKLKRRSIANLGGAAQADNADPSVGEQIVAHGGHLALSGVSGAIYGALTPDDVSPVVAGSIFGGAFYLLAYGLVGPSARISPVLWRDSRSSIAIHRLIHMLFGITTAVVARQAARRL